MNPRGYSLEFNSTGISQQYLIGALPARLLEVEESFPVNRVSKLQSVVWGFHLLGEHCEKIALAKHGIFSRSNQIFTILKYISLLSTVDQKKKKPYAWVAPAIISKGENL